MLSLLLYIFIIFVSLIWLGLISLDFGLYIYRKRGGEIYGKPKRFRPKTLVMLPCKGLDITLDANILSLKTQSYDNYKLVAIVASNKDKALEHIIKAGVDYIIADKDLVKCSGKVKNLLSAIRRFRGYDVYVVADSDVTFSTDWLESLVYALNSNKALVSTTYPYFNPLGGFWSMTKCVWNFVGEGMMESPNTRFAWGGSMAFKRELITERFLERMRFAVSDDIEVTRECRLQNGMIAYVKKRIAVVNISESFGTFIEWANRQTAFSIYGNRRLAYYGLVIYSANILLLLSGIILSIYVSYLYVFLLIPFIIGLLKSYRKLEERSLMIIPIYIMINFIYITNILYGSRMRSVRWRGRVYRLY